MECIMLLCVWCPSEVQHPLQTGRRRGASRASGGNSTQVLGEQAPWARPAAQRQVSSWWGGDWPSDCTEPSAVGQDPGVVTVLLVGELFCLVPHSGLANVPVSNPNKTSFIHQLHIRTVPPLVISRVNSCVSSSRCVLDVHVCLPCMCVNSIYWGKVCCITNAHLR